MGRTITEKILGRATGQPVRQGDFAWANVDLVSLMDSSNFSLWAKFFDANGLHVWDPQRIVISFDHFYRALGDGAGSFPLIRNWARRQGIPRENVFDVGRHGLSHQVPAEAGRVHPGTLYVAADTQGPTMGALNCLALACLDAVACIMATGRTWLRVPEAIRVHMRGTLPKGVLGKDIYFRLMQDLAGVAEGRVVEIGGPGIESMPVDVRMAVANGAPHIGATTTVFEPDRRLSDFLDAAGARSDGAVEADADADYAARFEYVLDDFEQLISGPDDPSRIQPLSAIAGTKVDAAYIGSCSSGRMEDLQLAAEVLRGRKVNSDVRLVVTPISSNVMQQAAEAGLLAAFTSAGATVTTPGCGACFSGNQSPLLLDDGETCITGSVENWPGRMGSARAKVYLASAAVVAASAIEGRIADPAKYYR